MKIPRVVGIMVVKNKWLKLSLRRSAFSKTIGILIRTGNLAIQIRNLLTGSFLSLLLQSKQRMVTASINQSITPRNLWRAVRLRLGATQETTLEAKCLPTKSRLSILLLKDNKCWTPLIVSWLETHMWYLQLERYSMKEVFIMILIL